MSLINQMLKDLERRGHVSGRSQNPQMTLLKTHQKRLHYFKWLRGIIIFFILAAAVLILAYPWLKSYVPQIKSAVKISKKSAISNTGPVTTAPTQTQAHPNTLIKSQLAPHQNTDLEIEMIEQRAKGLLLQNKVNEALNTLLQTQPPMTGHSRYYALIAAIYEQLDKPQPAAEIYQRLTTTEPTNGKWWLGLAVSLEQLQKTTEAVTAYQKALDTNSLNTELDSYIETRLQTLR